MEKAGKIGLKGSRFFTVADRQGCNDGIGGKVCNEAVLPFLALGAADGGLKADNVRVVFLPLGVNVMDGNPMLVGMGVQGGNAVGHIVGFDPAEVLTRAAANELGLNHFKEGQGDENEHHSRKGHGVVTAACGDAQTGYSPKAGGGGQTLDIRTLPEDGACTQKTDAGDDLCAQTGRVGGGAEDPVLNENQLTCDHHSAGAQCHQNVGAHTGRAVGILALRTDDHANQHGAKKPHANCFPVQRQRCQILLRQNSC